MNRILYTILSVFLLLPLNAQHKNSLPKWQEGYLDIHVMATAEGEATYMVFPDGTSMLVDASGIEGEDVSRYIQKFSEGTPSEGRLDYVILTHFHVDHMGGIKTVGEQMEIGKLLDRGWPSYDFPSAEYVREVSGGFIDDYRKLVDGQGVACERFDVGKADQIVCVKNNEKYRDIFRVVNLGANGESWTGNGTKKQVNYKGNPADIEENAFSCSMRVDYGKFRYYTGGDLTGGWWGMTPEDNPKERDFESPIASVCGPVTAMKLNHHGWKDSSNAFFIQTLSPEVVFISSADKTCPQYFTLKRVMDKMICQSEMEVFCTTDAAKELNPKPSHFIERMNAIGHLVIRVYEEGKKYQVFVMQNNDSGCPVIYKSKVKESK